MKDGNNKEKGTNLGTTLGRHFSWWHPQANQPLARLFPQQSKLDWRLTWVTCMFSTLLLTYVGSLSPSAQVWCGDQYLKAVQSALAENEQAFFRCFPSYYTRIQMRMETWENCPSSWRMISLLTFKRATGLKTELELKMGLSKLRQAWEYLDYCRNIHRFTKVDLSCTSPDCISYEPHYRALSSKWIESYLCICNSVTWSISNPWYTVSLPGQTFRHLPTTMISTDDWRILRQGD